MNNVSLIGRFGKDPECKKINGQNGEFSSFMGSIAVEGQTKKETYWLDLHAVGSTAENICKFFKKGDRIAIDGELTQYKDKEGKSRLSVRVRGFDFIEKKEGNNNG